MIKHGYHVQKRVRKSQRSDDHRDYKRIEAASGDEPRNKLNKSNGGGGGGGGGGQI